MPPFIKKGLRKTELAIKHAELATVDKAAYQLRCKLEGERFREVRTYKDVVDLNEWALNSLISGNADVKTVCAIGYMSVVSLQAIKLAKTESNPEEQLSEKLRQKELNLSMTEEEMKDLLNATNVNVQINILNRTATRPKAKDTEMLIQEYLGDNNIPSITSAVLRDAGKLARGTDTKEPEEDISTDILDIQPLQRKNDDRDDD